jgi:translation elongation factor EF-Tu-like GTPase
MSRTRPTGRVSVSGKLRSWRPWVASGGFEMVLPGDHTSLDVSLDKPIALETGSRFAIRECGKTVGSGVETAVLG